MISSPTTAWMDFAIGDDRAKEAVALGWRHSTPRAMSGHAPLFPSRAGAYPWARRLTPRSLATYEVEADEEVWAGGGKAVACPRQSSFFRRWQSCSLRRTNVEAQQLLGRPIPYHDANNGPPNLLLRSDGPWTYTDATEESGLNHNNTRYSFAASWSDFDSDGDQDLYVANDFGRNNLYENREGRFIDIAAALGVEDEGDTRALGRALEGAAPVAWTRAAETAEHRLAPPDARLS